MTFRGWLNDRIRPWWDAQGRALDEKNARAIAAARQQGASAVRSLQDLTDEELIAGAPARTSLSRPHNEMEMQRRLKDSIESLTAETTKARVWAAWGAGALVFLTLALVFLTVVLAVKG